MRERSEAEGRGQGTLIKQLLDPLDDLSRFAHVDPATVDAATLAQGVDMVERKLQKVLAAVGYRHNGQLLRPARVAVKQWNG